MGEPNAGVMAGYGFARSVLLDAYALENTSASQTHNLQDLLHLIQSGTQGGTHRTPPRSSAHLYGAQPISVSGSPTSWGSSRSSLCIETPSALCWLLSGKYVLQGLHYVVVFPLLVTLSLGADLQSVHSRNADASAVWHEGVCDSTL